MPQPTPYTRTTNFTDYSTSNPSNPQQGTSLDAEFNDIKTTTDQIRANLALLQRDDGDLKNASVHTEALSNAVLTLIKATANGYNVKGSWAVSTAYAVGDLVDFSQATYLCFDAHTSGSTFGANSSKFILLANAAIASTASAVDTFNGDGSQTAFTLSNNAPSDGGVTEVLVFVNGQLRTPTTQYTISSNVITFSTAPSPGTGNVIVWGTSTVVEAAKTAAQTARDTAETYRNTSQDHRDTSESYAVETGGVVKHFSGASNGTSGTGADQTGVYSAKEHAVGTSVDTGSAKDWATKPTTQVASTDYSSKEWATGTAATSSKSYAIKDDGVVTGTDYSAKAWAMSTDSDAPTGGSAKQWATKNNGAVDTEFSAKAYASVTGTHAPADGSAKEWATNAGSAEVATGQGYSSKTYASDTTASASTTGGSAKGWSQTAEDTAVPGAGASDRSALHYREKAKDFASKTSGQVTGDTGTADQGYSAKEWAQGTQTRGAVAGGSAKDWATYTSGTVDNSEYSAKYYATQAQQHAANAATSFDNFDDRYLGTNSSNPTNDNDGNALVTGALYFNTSNGEMRVYDGSSWIPASAAQSATILEYVYDITGSVTSIVGASGTGFAENNGAAVTFGSTESVHVYLNGVQLIQGASDDYQLTPASNTVTFNSAVVSGDIVKIVVYKTFTVGDAVPASTGGTFSGNVAYTGNIQVDDIVEKTSAHGVEIEQVTLKDGGGTFTGNVDFSNASDAIVTIKSDEANSAGNTDVQLKLRLDGADKYTIGVDDDDSDKLKIFTGGGFGGSGITMDSSGNVGIGVTSSLANRLHVEKAGSTVATFRTSNNNSGGGIELVGKNSSGAIQPFYLQSNASSELLFLQGTGATERMRIDSSGDVGIGCEPNVTGYQSGARVLSVEGNGQDDFGVIELRSTNATGTNRLGDIRFVNLNGTSSPVGRAGIRAFRDGADDATAMAFWTEPAGQATFTERMRIDSNGNVLIGSFSNVGTGDHKVSVDIGTTGRALGLGTSSTGAKILVSFVNGNGTVGDIRTSGTSTSYVTSSDYRLKENVTPLTGAIDRLNALKPSRFNFVADPETTLDGFLAHEVSGHVPEAVTGQKDAMTTEEFVETEAVFDEEGNEITPAIMGTREVIDPQGIDQSKLVPLLVASVQELSAKVTALESA